ncbi:hypothetical protein NKJ23_25360 [Mesorhizobium sp. M0184]|uniref:hypothetical protein n=1 Tax=Mesorhizobium sp. M0184 TaxID=2956906 RepID=UPI00333CF1A2
MKLVQQSEGSAQVIGSIGDDVVNALPGLVVEEQPIFEGMSCRVVLSLLYHYDIGGWPLTTPPSWDPNRIVASIDFYSHYGTEQSENQSRKIRNKNIGSQPPINTELPVFTFLAVNPLKVRLNFLTVNFVAVSFVLPRIGGAPLVLYIAGNVKIFVDENLVLDKNYASPGGEVHFEDKWPVIRRE